MKFRLQLKGLNQWQWLLDVAAILAWGVLLVKYWLNGKMNLLLHPNYIWLAYSAGFFLLSLGAMKLLQNLRRSRRPAESLQHLALLPPGLSSLILLSAALFGLQFTPQPFASDMALNRGAGETLTLTRSQPQAFRAAIKPENRSLMDWIKTLNVYPEPDAYTGQKVKLDGFVIHLPNLPQSHLGIARFVITCCAADAYPVGLPVKLPSGDRANYPPDQWFEIEGEMITETLDNRRQLVIQARKLTSIPTPKNPYVS